MKTTYKISCLPPTLILIALKLTHFIDWSWLWVLSPIWIPLALTLAICTIVGVTLFTISQLAKD